MGVLTNLGIALCALVVMTAFWRSMNARLQAPPPAANRLLRLSAFPPGVDLRREAPGVTDLRRLLDDMPGDCDPLLRSGDLRLALGTGAGPLRVMGRAQELRQLLAHVVGIACHAMPSGGILNVIALTEGRQIVVEFMDEGAGRREPLLAALYRHGSNSRPMPLDADSALATRVASCQRIVAEHGGRIDVLASRLGGLGLFVRLPLVEGLFALP
ncbi:MAG TPA: ATP-binding protein [Variovorax sp.]